MPEDDTGAKTSKIPKQDNQIEQPKSPATTKISKMRQLINEAFTVYEVRKSVFGQLSAYDVAKLSCSFGIGLDDSERKKYLNIARDIFLDTRPIDKLIAQGVAITLIGSNLPILIKRLQDPNGYEKMRDDRLRSLREKTNDSSKELPKHRIWIAVMLPVEPEGGSRALRPALWYVAPCSDVKLPGDWCDERPKVPMAVISFPPPATEKLTMIGPVDKTLRVDRFKRVSRNRVYLSGVVEHTFFTKPSLPADGLVVEYIKLHHDPFLVSKQQVRRNNGLLYGSNRHSLTLDLLPTPFSPCISIPSHFFAIPLFDCCSNPKCFQDIKEEVISCCSCEGKCDTAPSQLLPKICDSDVQGLLDQETAVREAQGFLVDESD